MQKRALINVRLFGRDMLLSFGGGVLSLATNNVGLPTLKEVHVLIGVWMTMRCYVDRILVTSL